MQPQDLNSPAASQFHGIFQNKLQQQDYQESKQQQSDIQIDIQPRRRQMTVEKQILNNENAEILYQIDNLKDHERKQIKQWQHRSEFIKFSTGNVDLDQVDVYISDADLSDDEVPYDQMNEKRIHRCIQRENSIKIIKGVVQRNSAQIKAAIQNQQHNKKSQTDKISLSKLMKKLIKNPTQGDINILVAFLRKKGPFWYTKRPRFYDKLSQALVQMNRQSFNGLVDIYNLTTCYPQQMYSGYPKYSNLKSNQDQYIKGQNYGQSLYDKYAKNNDKVKFQPQGNYRNQVRIAAWAIPLNISYGSYTSLQFLQSLQKCQVHEIFKCVCVQGLINYKWDQARWFLLTEAIIHALYLIIYNVFAINNDAHDSSVIIFLILVFSLILLSRQFLQLIARGCSYYKDPWNLPDLGMIFCGIIGIFIQSHTYSSGYNDLKKEWFLTITILLQWYRAVSYFRIWKRTRHLIHTITETMYDMIPFLMVLVMVIFCYSSAYMASFPEQQGKQLKYSDRLFEGYNILIGEVDFQTANAVTYLVYVIMTLIPVIVLLNMLIALMGETFGRVSANQVVYDYRQKLSVVIDLESIMYIFKKNKRKLLHIGVIRRPGGFEDVGSGGSDDEKWVAINQLKQQIKEGFDSFEKKFDSLEKKFNILIGRKLDNQERQ